MKARQPTDAIHDSKLTLAGKAGNDVSLPPGPIRAVQGFGYGIVRRNRESAGVK